MEAVGERRWRTRIQARASRAPDLRHEVVALVARECPGLEPGSAALVVTELAANVIHHAYTEESGPLEVEVRCDHDSATLTVRDWGRGFGRSAHRGTGIGLQIVRGLAQDVRIEHGDCTMVETRLARQRSDRAHVS